MSIKTRILLACLGMTAVTLLFGATMWHAQTRLGTIGTQLYDEAFLSMAHIRAAQHEMLAAAVRLAAGERGEAVRAPLRAAAEDAAQGAALSPRGRGGDAALREPVLWLQRASAGTDGPPDPAQLREVQDRFDHAVQVNAGDGFVARRQADAVIQSIGRETWFALAASVASALLITALLSRVILRSVGEVVQIATRIAGGRLDNAIAVQGPSEIASLRGALARMQGSIASRMRQIQALIARRETDFRAEMQTERQKLEIALENMAQALCLYDDEGRILLVNQQFVALFGEAGPSETITERVLPRLEAPIDFGSARRAASSQVVRLTDGRSVSVVLRRMESSGSVATFEDITEQVQAEERLQYIARHDLLTGLANRETFKEQAEALCQTLVAEQRLLVLYLGVDRFKVLNETLGEAAGDRLLCIIAERLQHSTRRGDPVARVGGDEFAVASVSRGHAEGRALADRLRAALGAPVVLNDQHLTLTASVGIALSDRSAGMDAVLAQAELALRKAKSGGGDTTSFYEQVMDDELQERRRLEAELREAVALQQFRIEYQPFVSASTRDVVGYEALVRWAHPERGRVMPAEFLPLAEETGLITEIGWQVLREACREAATWDAGLNLAVNVSSRQFRDPNFVPLVGKALKESGLAAERLELEVTEAILLRQSGPSLLTFDRLKEMGVRVSMDDFGTGFSSLSYLNKFRFDRLKIDRSFIQNLQDTAESLAILRAAISLGRAFEMSVVAEGVETESQLELVVREGCDLAQGFYLGKPDACPAGITVERDAHGATVPAR